jgi:uncharacterized protein YdhG (YjbR/CyaY superfamily)
MKSNALTVAQYLDELPTERKEFVEKLRNIILTNLPAGFEEELSYGMIGYVVPHSIYPNGYHCNTKLPLPFINVASQKNFVAFYHMALYFNSDLLQWFTSEFAKQSKHKLDMGKSCIRFKKPEQIPFELIAELVSKISVQMWVELYEKNLKLK